MLFTYKLTLELQEISDLLKNHSLNNSTIPQRYIKYFFQEHQDIFFRVYLDRHFGTQLIKNKEWFAYWRDIANVYEKDYEEDEDNTDIQIFVRDILFTAKKRYVNVKKWRYKEF